MPITCFYHDADGDLRGWTNENPSIWCSACRRDGYFTKDEIEKYCKGHYRNVAVFTRREGYPLILNVIMDDGDGEEEALNIKPKSEFKLTRVGIEDPYCKDDNTVVLRKPKRGTLEDTRWWDRTKSGVRVKGWDKAPWGPYR